MQVCIPTRDDHGLEAEIDEHFGSAPYFTLYDTEFDDLTVVANTNAHHSHGTCHPLSQLADRSLDALIVGGIGRRALLSLQERGLRVLRPFGRTAGETLGALRDGTLVELNHTHACAGRGHRNRRRRGRND